MKATQVKLLLGWILALSALNLIVIIIVMVNLGSVKMQVKNLNGGSSDKTQLSAMQTSVDGLTAELNQTKSTSPAPVSSLSKETTCTGTLNLNLSGSILNSYANFSSITPVNLTCNPL